MACGVRAVPENLNLLARARAVKTKLAAKGASPSQGTQTLADLDQIRILAHPLRLRILGALVRQPRTTKQVAELLGEKHTKLYHHVQALERARVIRLTETRQKRGTTERYYQATAALFQAASSAFAGPTSPAKKRSHFEAMLNALLDSARRDVLAHLATVGASGSGDKKRILAARLILRGPRAKLLRAANLQISRALRKMPANAKQLPARGGGKKIRKLVYALTIIVSPTTES
jgi:DNA-binding transcriptional ArsR family regulator